MLVIKRYISLLLCSLLLITSCTKNNNFAGGEKGELIINETKSEIRMVCEESESFLPVSNISASIGEVIDIVYEPLFDFDDALNPIPVLAESCVRDSDNRYTVTLKSDVLWHDGQNFDANDVVYTVNCLKESGNIFSKDVENIQSVEIVNNTKVVFVLSRPTPNFLGLLSFPVVKKGSAEDDGNIPVGTGPYKFKEKKGNTYYFDRNDKWHGDEPSNKIISVTLMKDKESAVYAFEANEADVISSELMDLSKNTPKGQATVQNYISNNLTFLGMNTTEGILSNPEVRKGVSYLIDKEELIEKCVYGRGVPADVPIYPKAWFYSSENEMLKIEGDENYLEKILNNEGWYKKDGLYTRDFGSYEAELTLSILVNKDNPEKLSIAQNIASTLKENGIIVKVKAYGYDQYMGRVRDMDFSMFIGEIVMEKNMDPSKLCKSGENYFGYQSEAMDEIINRLSLAKSNDELTECFSEFGGLFEQDMPFLPLFFRQKAMIATSSLSGYGMPNYYRPFQDIENWYFSQKAEKRND